MNNMAHGPNALTHLIGKQVGHSAWFTVDQTRIDVFGAVTDDLEPLHNDPAWCAKNSPYGKPISYGFLTLSLLPRFMAEITNHALTGANGRTGFPLNYGCARCTALIP